MFIHKGVGIFASQGLLSESAELYPLVSKDEGWGWVCESNVEESQRLQLLYQSLWSVKTSLCKGK